MTKKQALAKLKKTRVITTDMLKPLKISMDSWLKYAQLSDEAAKKLIDKFIKVSEDKEAIIL